MSKKDILVFSLCFLAIAAIFFLIPINMFDGEIIFEKVNGVELMPAKAKLSLSYFIGIGAGKEELKGIKDFHLLPMGYFFAFLMLVGIPGLITFRLNLNRQKKESNSSNK